MISEENIHAALLAKMVGLELKDIDSRTTESLTMPASRINPNSFLGQTNQAPQHIPQQIIHQVPPQQPPPPSIEPEVSKEFREDLKSIRCTLERINNNLTKLTGMFGKVFHNLNKNSQSEYKDE
jgi:hypothetical protein